MTGRAHRWVAASVAVIAVAGLSGVVAPAAVADGGRHGGDRLRWENVASTVSIRVGTPNCDPLAPDRCVYPFNNASSWVGDVAGHQVQSGAIVLLGTAGATDSTATSWVTATVKGCPGPGSFAVAWRSRGQPDGSARGSADVVEGSGTSGLAGLRGSFSFEVTINAQGQRATAYAGRLRCDD
jgi:Protein of unknown function (DUF3224)